MATAPAATRSSVSGSASGVGDSPSSQNGNLSTTSGGSPAASTAAPFPVPTAILGDRAIGTIVNDLLDPAHPEATLKAMNAEAKTAEADGKLKALIAGTVFRIVAKRASGEEVNIAKEVKLGLIQASEQGLKISETKYGQLVTSTFDSITKDHPELEKLGNAHGIFQRHGGFAGWLRFASENWYSAFVEIMEATYPKEGHYTRPLLAATFIFEVVLKQVPIVEEVWRDHMLGLLENVLSPSLFETAETILMDKAWEVLAFLSFIAFAGFWLEFAIKKFLGDSLDDIFENIDTGFVDQRATDALKAALERKQAAQGQSSADESEDASDPVAPPPSAGASTEGASQPAPPALHVDTPNPHGSLVPEGDGGDASGSGSSTPSSIPTPEIGDPVSLAAPDAPSDDRGGDSEETRSNSELGSNKDSGEGAASGGQTSVASAGANSSSEAPAGDPAAETDA